MSALERLGWVLTWPLRWAWAGLDDWAGAVADLEEDR